MFFTVYTPNDTLTSRGSKNELTLFHPTIALNRITKKNRIREIELTNFDFRVRDEQDALHAGTEQAQRIHLNIAVRYESIYSFFKNKDSRIKPQLGVAFSPFITYDRFTPYISHLIPSSEMIFGVKHYVVPRCLIRISSKWHADINTPVLFMQARLMSQSRQDSSIPVAEQKSTVFDFDMFQKEYSIRLGISYTL